MSLSVLFEGGGLVFPAQEGGDGDAKGRAEGLEVRDVRKATPPFPFRDGLGAYVNAGSELLLGQSFGEAFRGEVISDLLVVHGVAPWSGFRIGIGAFFVTL